MTLASIALACITVAAYAKPEQVHTAFAGADSSGRYISWFTQDSTETSTVRFWMAGSPSKVTAVAGEQLSYLDGYGFHHHVRIPQLDAGTAYEYKVGDEKAGWSEVFSLKVAAKGAPFTAAVFGDWGYLDSVARPYTIPVGGLERNWSASVTRGALDRMDARGEVDFVFNVGDVSYADDSYGHVTEFFSFDFEHIYGSWMNWIQNLSSAHPYMVSPGNHESECHSPVCIVRELRYGLKLSNFTAYNSRWRMPSAADESGGKLNMWYSWRTSNAHFVSINTETDLPGAGEETHGDSGIFRAGGFGRDGEYLEWLEKDLAAAAADPSIDWILAGGHRPLTFAGADKVLALFKKYGVDMYLCGHAHSYSRYEAKDYDGVVQIVVGGAGNDEHAYPEAGSEKGLSSTKLSAPEACAEWCKRSGAAAHAKAEHCRAMGLQNVSAVVSHEDHCDLCGLGTFEGSPQPAFFSAEYAIGRLHVDGGKLHWELLKSADDTVLDELKLTKERGNQWV